MNACQILADKARPIYPQFALSDRLQVRSTPLSLTTHPAVVRSNTAILRYGRYGYCRASSTISAVSRSSLVSLSSVRSEDRTAKPSVLSLQILGSLHQLVSLHRTLVATEVTSATPMEPTPSARSWPCQADNIRNPGAKF